MCLIINHRNLKTAKKEISVFKILLKNPKGKYYSPFKHRPLKVNKEILDTEEPEIVKDKKTGVRTVGKGFYHSFMRRDEAMRILNLFKEKNKVPKNCTIGVYDAIIPIGSKYYEGKYKDICSKSLMILAQ